MSWKLYEGDCLEVMPLLEDKSVDMILCDLPYGTTACKWDTIIPFEPLWREYERLIKDNGAIVLTASQPFTSALVMSNSKMFRYELVWDKEVGTNFGNAKYMPLKYHENILVFYKKLPNYNPQMFKSDKISSENKGHRSKSKVSFSTEYAKINYENTGYRFPKSIIHFNSQCEECNNTNRIHPTQKPVKLFEYLIKTYTNEGDLILDNCAGSGTTGVASQNLNRDCIMIEQEHDYCEIIRERMKEQESLQVEQRKQKTLNEFEGQMTLTV